MDVRVELKLLIPGVQHTEEADFGPQMSGIAGDFEKRFRTGSEQQIVDDFLVLQSQGRRHNFLFARHLPKMSGNIRAKGQ